MVPSRSKRYALNSPGGRSRAVIAQAMLPRFRRAPQPVSALGRECGACASEVLRHQAPPPRAVSRFRRRAGCPPSARQRALKVLSRRAAVAFVRTRNGPLAACRRMQPRFLAGGRRSPTPETPQRRVVLIRAPPYSIFAGRSEKCIGFRSLVEQHELRVRCFRCAVNPCGLIDPAGHNDLLELLTVGHGWQRRRALRAVVSDDGSPAPGDEFRIRVAALASRLT